VIRRPLWGGRGVSERADDLTSQHNPHADMSRLDYAVLRDLATRHPDATRHALGQALRQGSPNLAQRKTNERWLTSYVENTTTAVLLNPEVQQARAGYQREQGGRGRGPPKGWPALEPARADTLSFVCQRQRPMCHCNEEDQTDVARIHAPTHKKARRTNDGP